MVQRTQHSTKTSLVKPELKLQPLVNKEVAGVAAVDEDEEEEVKDKEEVAEEAKEEGVKIKEEAKEEVEAQDTLAIRLSAMLTYPHLKPVSGTGPSGSPHTSVWSPPPAPGKTSGSPSPTTEGLTSPATRRQVT